ncbi:MAG TPA: cyclopropane-fatty-acyl-phospholipid synthase family protein [Methyloceanibacter sp.]|nr:cyclopropane-fatty-acyl-phospholipid synthase family protein [Methyloceanibacter sp.]
MFAPLRQILDLVVTSGCLDIVDAGGRRHSFGDRRGDAIAVRIADKRTERQLALHPTLAVGEAYMDGRLIVERGTVYDFVELLAANLPGKEWPWPVRLFERLRFLTRRLWQINFRSFAKRNVARHYDLDGRLYDLFLDEDRQYSCAYFERPNLSLDAAQAAKKRHLAAKLKLEDGMTVLDIGSGWGGLALYLAKTAHVRVTGVTLSENQLKIARERAQAMGLAKAVKFELRDYRDLDEQFDRIVSVGMFEHVGISHYGGFFDRIGKLLKPDGVALVHSIGRFDGPAAMNPFITKYIFPGAHLPSLSEVLPAVERRQLFVTDIEIWRLHYAMTLRHWRQRFRANWNTAVELYGERFCRMWEFYLAMCEAGFRYQNLMVFQLQMTRDLNALPLTRDYMFEAEQRMRQRDGEQGQPGRRRSTAS